MSHIRLAQDDFLAKILYLKGLLCQHGNAANAEQLLVQMPHHVLSTAPRAECIDGQNCATNFNN